jgi:hypothetical protein
MAQPASSGNGSSNGTTCKTCGGRGIIAAPNGKMWQTCPTCNGTGQQAQDVIRVPWSLQWNVTLTPGQQNVPVVTQQDSDADFEWIYTTATSVLANGAAGLYAVQLKDNSTGRVLSSGFVNGELFAGTAQLPFVLPEPYLISRTATIQANFNERSNVGGENNTIQLVAHGYKLFPAAAPMQGSAGAIVAAAH